MDLKHNIWPIGNYRNYVLKEYTIDSGGPFGEKTVYIKIPMRLEDFDMGFSEDFIRSNIKFHTTVDPLTRDFRITASFKASNGPEFKATGDVSHFATIAGECAFQNMKHRLVDVIICKVKTYYEGRGVIKEEKKMPISMRYCDEICEYLGLTTKAPNNKPKWTEGLPAVKKVETYNQRVVKVTFIDDTFTKSVCSENDHFDIDVGITICLLKRILGTNGDDATRNYNKLMNHVHAVMAKNEKERIAKKAMKEADKVKKRKAELKRAAKKLKAKEEQIDIYKQGILRAMNEREDDMK